LEADVNLRHEIYRACGGEEHFLSFEGQDDTLVGFLRLRLTEGGDRRDARARVRELHVYGPMVPIGTRKEGWQHKGYGARLVEAAEVIAGDKGYDRLEITSGIGARGYYERLGYDLRGHYMAKDLAW
jgi:elongator complex protein 3